ncbi:MAG: PrpR N-terminal domain-containing protein [Faecousia sp.]
MEKAKILAIAPYHDFQAITQQIAAEFPDIDLDSYAGNLDVGLEYMQSRSLEDYDVVISRGGTAQKLRDSLNIMVVEAEVSAFDMLRCIKMAEATKKPFAVVGYANIVETARTIVQILNLSQVAIREVTQQTVVPCLRELAAQNIQLVIGDVVTTEAAVAMDLQSILVTSSADSIRKALQAAVSLSHTARRKKEKQMMHLAAIDLCPHGILIFDERFRLLRSNSASLQLDLGVIKAALQEATIQERGNMDLRVLQRAGDSMYDITIRCKIQNGHPVYYCFIQVNYKPQKFVGSIQIENTTTPVDRPYFLFSDSAYIQPVHELLNHALCSSNSVMIWGDIGTEKASVARYIYRNGLHASRPLICINCQTLTQKQWHSFTDSQSCMLNASGFTVLFENIQDLSAELLGCLSNYIEDTQLQKRHQLLTTCTRNPTQMVLDRKLPPLLMRQLSQIQIHMPSLNSRKEDIEALASVYIAQLNRTLGLEVIGLEPEALQLMKDFYWALNLDQFHSVLYQLAVKTHGYYISAEDTRQTLAELRPEQTAVSDHDWLDLTKPLDEIEHDIILHVLQEEDMNQSRAAKRLKIGRSTLWRKLN